MRVLRGFDFRRGTTVIHKVDPRAKLIYVALFTALTILYANPLVLLLLFASTLPLVMVAKVAGRWGQSIRGSYLFLVLIFIFNFIVLYFQKNDIFGAALTSVSMVIRFITLISLFSTFFLTTAPEDLTQSMVQMKIPYDYALTFNMAMRFVPTLSREAQIIVDAQKSRGLEMEKGNLVQKIRNYIPVLVPLIVSSFRRAELVADAMESRAFGASKKRTSLYVLTMQSRDYLFILISVAAFLLILSLRIFLGIL
jgi:energy-coupling factor transport system permease protein